MTEREIKDTLAAIRSFSEKLSASPELADEVLTKLGAKLPTKKKIRKKKI